MNQKILSSVVLIAAVAGGVGYVFLQVNLRLKL